MRLWPRRKVYDDTLPKTHDLRFGLLFFLGVVALLGGLYGVGHLVVGDTVPTGTTVSGVDIGGMSSGRAEAALREELAPELLQPVTVVVEERRFTFTPQQAGMTFDIDATVADALGGDSWSPRHMLRVATGGGVVQPVIEVDPRELQARLSRVASPVERPPVDATVAFVSGQPKLAAGEPGIRLDLAMARARLLAAIRGGETTVRVSLTTVQPEITTSEAADFVAGPAARAVSAPVTVKLADTRLVVRPNQFASALRVVADDSALHLEMDAITLLARTRQTLASVPHHPVDARIGFRDGRPVVVPSRSGVTVARDEWAEAILEAARRPAGGRGSSVEPVAQPPGLTTQEARQLQVVRRLADVAVAYPTSVDRAAVRRAVGRLDGVLLLPRWSFSFLRRVGADDPEAASLVASAAYEAALRAGMTGIQRTPWPSAPGTVQLGFDAGVDVSGRDLTWDNDTPYGIYLRAWGDSASGGAVHVEVWSSLYWRVTLAATRHVDRLPPPLMADGGESCIPRLGSPGATVDVVRTLVHGGQTRRDIFSSRLPPRPTVVCHPVYRGGVR